MLKQPGHFTSMKNELGVCTNRFSLCRLASTDGSGCSRSISYGDWAGCRAHRKQTGLARGQRGCAKPQSARMPPVRGAAPGAEPRGQPAAWPAADDPPLPPGAAARQLRGRFRSSRPAPLPPPAHPARPLPAPTPSNTRSPPSLPPSTRSPRAREHAACRRTITALFRAQTPSSSSASRGQADHPTTTTRGTMTGDPASQNPL